MTITQVLDEFQAEIDSLKDRGVVTAGLVQEWINRLRQACDDEEAVMDALRGAF